MLSSLLLSQVFAFLLIFSRVGSAVMVLPGFGEPYVSPRVRLVLALLLSLVLLPGLTAALPPVPSSPLALFLLLMQEIIVGIFIGMIVNTLASVMHTVGMIFSYQSGLSSAVLFDPTQATQGTSAGNFLGILAITLMFALNLHHLMLQGVVESYTLFVPGHPLPLGDFANLTSRTVSMTFVMALKLSAPMIVVGLLLSLAGGVLSRLMPIIPIFFIIISPQMLLGFFLLMISITGVMLLFIRFFEESLKGLF